MKYEGLLRGAGLAIGAVGCVALAMGTAAGLMWAVVGTQPFHEPQALFFMGLIIAAVGGAMVALDYDDL